MSWQEPEGAIGLTFSTGHPGVAALTSTSTVHIGPGCTLRMFGVNSKNINDDAPVEIPKLSQFANLPAGCRGGALTWQSYIDSDGDGRFALDYLVGDAPIETCVPFQRAVTGWSYQKVSARSGPPNCAVTVESATDDFYVVYKDVHVLPVPRVLGGGYLMLLGRYRTLQSDVQTYWDSLTPNQQMNTTTRGRGQRPRAPRHQPLRPRGLLVRGRRLRG